MDDGGCFSLLNGAVPGLNAAVAAIRKKRIIIMARMWLNFIGRSGHAGRGARVPTIFLHVAGG